MKEGGGRFLHLFRREVIFIITRQKTHVSLFTYLGAILLLCQELEIIFNPVFNPLFPTSSLPKTPPTHHPEFPLSISLLCNNSISCHIFLERTWDILLDNKILLKLNFSLKASDPLCPLKSIGNEIFRDQFKIIRTNLKNVRFLLNERFFQKNLKKLLSFL